MPRRTSTAPSQEGHRPHGPAYMEHALGFDQVAGHRHLTCGLYGVCLEVAVHRRWPSFTCRECSLWPAVSGLRPCQGPARILHLPRTIH